MRSKPPIKKPRQITFIVTERGCHECTSHAVNKGYFTCYVNGKSEYMHRHFYQLKNGPIPKGMLIRHKCDNSKCINADHLEIGTHLDNQQDCVKRGRKPKGENTVMAKITEKQALRIIEIGRLRSYHSLSREFGISPASVRDIILRNTWKHLG